MEACPGGGKRMDFMYAGMTNLLCVKDPEGRNRYDH